MQAMAAVLLEEWLLELAAIAQEHSVIHKEHFLDMGAQLTSTDMSKVSRIPVMKRKS